MIIPSRPMRSLSIGGMLVLGVTLACAAPEGSAQYRVVRTLPHDPAAYTQGLLLSDGVFYESVGQYGFSDVRRVEVETGRVLARQPLHADRFGEGLARHGNRLIQLTWQHQTGYVYDVESLAVVDSFTYAGEGWGLTSDDTTLIMSDGTATLRFLDPESFAVVKEVRVTENGAPLSKLNELEYADGVLYANIYQSNWIVRIDPATGFVLGWIDLDNLVPADKRGSEADVMNGIAWDPATGHFFVTGKRWPMVYEVEFTQGVGSRE